MLTIHKIEKWSTSDGTEHASQEMAEHWVILQQMVEVLKTRADLSEREAHDVLNALGTSKQDRQMVRDWLDASDKMEEASLCG